MVGLFLLAAKTSLRSFSETFARQDMMSDPCDGMQVEAAACPGECAICRNLSCRRWDAKKERIEMWKCVDRNSRKKGLDRIFQSLAFLIERYCKSPKLLSKQQSQ